MFFGLELEGLQIYWWLILSLLGGLLVFMFFVFIPVHKTMKPSLHLFGFILAWVQSG